jgi:hypothetical protein
LQAERSFEHAVTGLLCWTPNAGWRNAVIIPGVVSRDIGCVDPLLNPALNKPKKRNVNHEVTNSPGETVRYYSKNSQIGGVQIMLAKTTIARLVGGAAALLALGTLTLTPSAKADPPVVNPGGPMRGGQERHPEIRHALRALENAKDHLQNADHDFGGHRVDAINACNQAMEQLKICLRYDRN